MASAFVRLIALLALIAMPLGMASAPAAAQPASGAAMAHCDDQKAPDDAPAQQMLHCAVCAALPAIDHVGAGAELRPEPLLHAAAVVRIEASEPEIATPPPKLG